MAREAIARLYDVDHNSIAFKRPLIQGKYDQGTISFRAKVDKLIQLDRLHESVWATRLSGGTRSALVSLDVTVMGRVSVKGGVAMVEVPQQKQAFVLASAPQADANDDGETALQRLVAAVERGETVVAVTGRLESWTGHWPKFLNKPPPTSPKIFLADFKTDQDAGSEN